MSELTITPHETIFQFYDLLAPSFFEILNKIYPEFFQGIIPLTTIHTYSHIKRGYRDSPAGLPAGRAGSNLDTKT
jgi:hypothetical protein